MQLQSKTGCVSKWIWFFLYFNVKWKVAITYLIIENPLTPDSTNWTELFAVVLKINVHESKYFQKVDESDYVLEQRSIEANYS